MRPADTCFGRSRRIVHLHPVHPLRHKPRWKLLRQTYLCHRILPLRTMVYPHGPLPAGNKFQQTQLHSRYTAAGIGIREVPAYLDKIPAAASPILQSADSLPQRSAVLKRQRVPAVFCNAHHDVPDTQHPDTDLCNPACFRLHRILRLQPASPAESFTIFVGSIAVCIGIVTFVASLMPEARADGYWMDNIATWPHTNYPLSAGAQAIVTSAIMRLLSVCCSVHGHRATSCSKKNNCSLWTSRPTSRYTSRL